MFHLLSFLAYNQTTNIHKDQEPIQCEISDTSLHSIDSNLTPNSQKCAKEVEIQTQDFQEILVESEQSSSKSPLEENSSPHLLKSSSNLSVESYYILDDLTKEGLQKYLKDAMLVFDDRYSVEDK